MESTYLSCSHDVIIFCLTLWKLISIYGFKHIQKQTKPLQLFIQTVLTRKTTHNACTVTLLIKTLIFTRSLSSSVCLCGLIKPIFPSSWTYIYVLMCYHLIHPYHFYRSIFLFFPCCFQNPLLGLFAMLVHWAMIVWFSLYFWTYILMNLSRLGLLLTFFIV